MCPCCRRAVKVTRSTKPIGDGAARLAAHAARAARDGRARGPVRVAPAPGELALACVDAAALARRRVADDDAASTAEAARLADAPAVPAAPADGVDPATEALIAELRAADDAADAERAAARRREEAENLAAARALDAEDKARERKRKRDAPPPRASPRRKARDAPPVAPVSVADQIRRAKGPAAKKPVISIDSSDSE